MDKKDTVIEFLMEMVVELKKRGEYLDNHIDKQNTIIHDMIANSWEKEKEDEVLPY